MPWLSDNHLIVMSLHSIADNACQRTNLEWPHIAFANSPIKLAKKRPGGLGAKRTAVKIIRRKALLL